MSGDPVGFFSMLLHVCIRDDSESRSLKTLFTFTAVSFVLGIAASAFTAYVLALMNL
jgi:hypothetical protein